MKKLLGILGMVLAVGIVGCATDVEKGDELAQQGKYEEAIKLYEQVKSDDEEYGKAQEGINSCSFQLGEIEFNGKNWEKAIVLSERAATAGRRRISHGQRAAAGGGGNRRTGLSLRECEYAPGEPDMATPRSITGKAENLQ